MAVGSYVKKEVVHTSAYVSIRQHASGYVSMRQDTSGYVLRCVLIGKPLAAGAANGSDRGLVSSIEV